MTRTRGLGRVFQRPRSPYWWIAYVHRGREIRESSGSEKKRDAVALLQARQAAIHEGQYVSRDADRVTVAELLADLRVDYEIKRKASRRTLRSHIAAWDAKLGPEKAAHVARPMLNGIIQEWQGEGRAPATINKFITTLRRAFRLGQLNKKVRVLPDFPEKLPEHNARQGFAAWGMVLALLAALPDDGLRDFVEWGVRTAMRLSEIARLTWTAYDRETGVVRLPGQDAKTGQPRRIVLGDTPLRMIIERRWADRRLDCPLIFHRDGRPIVEFRKSWASACRAVGLIPGRAGLTFHDLRRTGLRNLVRAGVSQHVAMAISGHKTPSTFRRYDITSDEDLREAMEKTTAYLEGLPTTSKVHALARRESVAG